MKKFCIAAFLLATLVLGYLSLNPMLSEGIQTPETKALQASADAKAQALKKAADEAADEAKALAELERRERAATAASAKHEANAMKLKAKAEADAKALAIQKEKDAAILAADAKALEEQKIDRAAADASLLALAQATKEEKTKKVEQEIAQIIALNNIKFNTASAVITKNSTIILDKVAEQLQKVPTANVKIQGHTDKTGNATRNQQLSQKRAIAVKTYLINKGITPERLSAKGFGSSAPLVDASTPEANAKNRRVEFKLK